MYIIAFITKCLFGNVTVNHFNIWNIAWFVLKAPPKQLIILTHVMGLTCSMGESVNIFISLRIVFTYERGGFQAIVKNIHLTLAFPRGKENRRILNVILFYLSINGFIKPDRAWLEILTLIIFPRLKNRSM